MLFDHIFWKIWLGSEIVWRMFYGIFNKKSIAYANTFATSLVGIK
ncbi:hypothetical protein MNV_370041 [Candidatus Methanoperedens nitroreducens]|uniref:Uncharacterized protein n=1 Tax=Candidatus Methanoperedens nitratireducens TaxID=1392998 RepID=A0A284VQL3_9EURY|nr:hypothetical protein MNV_370041 [Candidatus Methanoperedens nitroreducens]